MDQSTGKYEYPVFQYSKFEVSAICRLAGEMRKLSCTCDLNQRPMRGGYNWAVFILFADGIQWVLRSPAHNHPDLSERSAIKLLLSEAATLRYLKIYTDIPVPDVYSYCAYRNNPVRIPYILMSKAQGKSLNTMWGNDDLRGRLDSREMNKVMSQLGQITWDLAQVRFPFIGSLFEVNGSFVVGECLSKGHIQHKRHSLEGIPRGPFGSETKFYRSLILALTEHAEKLPLGNHCFTAPVPSRNDYANKDMWQCARDLWNQFVTVGQKIDSAANRVDYVVAAYILDRLISQYERNWYGVTSPVNFPLCHPDLTMNNIFVDDQYNITCIIDWAFATTVPLPLLLSPPGFPQSRHRLDERVCLGFRHGFHDAARPNIHNIIVGLSVPKAIQCIQNSEFAWCLTRFLAFDSTDDISLFRTMWESVYPSDHKLESYFFSERALPYYQTLYKKIREEDLAESRIKKSESDLFTKSMTFELSLARHLTMVSDWGFNYDPFDPSGLRDTEEEQIFVTEGRVWRWILEFKRQYRDRIIEERNF
ncbi:Protein kinase-like domain [Penicillium camemberti]|uniref:Protein kinase-like domain n=1 Tax=Penicillium camemberti (strain FM 013) TaxID=1429867 RepID=A0A0G4NYW1_PENC3|nr:Protein kinase-like domain [Penicillium camemberti]